MATRQFIYLICDTILSSKYYVKKHEDIIHRRKDKKLDCQDCGKQFTQKDKFTKHIISIHKGIKYKCKQCDKEFKTASHRSTHVKSLHEQK